MARTKQIRRRPTREIPPPLPCLTEYVEEDWFEEESEKTTYSERLSRMTILPPRYVGGGAIPEDKYPEFWRLINVQGLRQFLLQREGSPRHAAEDLTFRRKLDTHISSRMLRQLSKLEPVPEKSDKYTE
ncbi:hypothetical protein PIB30_026751 [Stylosanthes scabra]|uniref:Uncharacterized protein n=1 Tax=Stylosanthes scabra TaxID=79078 RepID=A0ABU6WAL2_9FABA|nr:hypothetical protein [Stylosanthes scabra]